MKEKAEARASFIAGMAGIEALSNTILSNFGRRTKEDLPDALLSKAQKKSNIDRWRLIDKIYFLPTLCNQDLLPPACYFNKESEAFKLFEELVLIRNGIMHGRPVPTLMLVKLKPNKKHEMKDSFDLNFWPLTKIPKDFSIFNHDCAKIAYDKILWVRDSLVNYLDMIDDIYLKEDKINLISRVIKDDEVTEDYLLKNWKEYINK